MQNEAWPGAAGGTLHPAHACRWAVRWELQVQEWPGSPGGPLEAGMEPAAQNQASRNATEALCILDTLAMCGHI